MHQVCGHSLGSLKLPLKLLLSVSHLVTGLSCRLGSKILTFQWPRSRPDINGSMVPALARQHREWPVVGDFPSLWIISIFTPCRNFFFRSDGYWNLSAKPLSSSPPRDGTPVTLSMCFVFIVIYCTEYHLPLFMAFMTPHLLLGSGALISLVFF